jgi:hypothetical protein
MSNYPPGVTGNEPQITGEWPCDDCGGRGYEEDEDGKSSCPSCDGTGVYPELAWEKSEIIRILKGALTAGGFQADEFEFSIDNDGYLNIQTPYYEKGIFLRID